MRYSKAKTKEIIFPLGGIGTGSIGLCGNGRFQDWEIFNRPSKGSYNGYSHIAVKAEWQGRSAARVLNGDIGKDLMGAYRGARFGGYGFGPATGSMVGFPHFRHHAFSGEFPFATLTFSDEDFPCRMTLEAFNPFTPGCSYDSSLPLAFFTVTFANGTDSEMDVTGALSVTNPYAQTQNRCFGEDGVTLYDVGAEGTPDEGNISLLAVGEQTGAEEYWYRGSWQDNIATFWRQFAEGDLPSRHYDDARSGDTATVWARAHICPHGKASVRFLLAWYNPICENDWDRTAKDAEGRNFKWRNWYATQFSSSLAVAEYGKAHFDSLRRRSMDFVRAFRHATLPREVKEAATANLSVLKSPTVLRWEDGTFWGWEGLHEKEGSCQGTCTHVWNYAYALCYLFPDLERSIRESDYRYNQRENGLMRFRLPIPPTPIREEEMACVDGQMGGIIRTYREWKLSGDTEWLRSLWPMVVKALNFATSEDNRFRWDYDGDGILEGRQHHTLDMELFGPSSWLEGFYLAALKAGISMARALGDGTSAAAWEKLYRNGSDFTERALFNGEYYIQKIDLGDRRLLEPFGESVLKSYWNEEAKEIKYQIGEGSEIDQLCAQWHAHLCGLGDIFDPAHRKTALAYMYRHNFKKTVRNLTNTWRNFIANDEAGAVICDYGSAYKPVLPIPYTEECMHGFEYQFAGLLMAEGFVGEGLSVVRGVRDRYDGEKRNPYNEMECGSNYARSMASFALIPILSGFTFDYTRHAIGFCPIEKREVFCAPFGIGGAFGTVHIQKGEVKIRVLCGTLLLSELSLPETAGGLDHATADGKAVPMAFEAGKILFGEEPVRITRSLRIFRKQKGGGAGL